jgi:ankyrin repeat protein
VRQTPLLLAIEHGHEDVVDFLLKNGADVQISDNVNMTPLYAAIKGQNLTIVENLIQAGCDINIGSQDHAPLFSISPTCCTCQRSIPMFIMSVYKRVIGGTLSIF